MNRSRTSWSGCEGGVPRTRGDEPEYAEFDGAQKARSPHTRG